MIIKVKIKPGAREENILQINENEFVVSVKERAVNGKANDKLLKILAKKFGWGIKEIKIKNPTSRKKLIEINRFCK